MKRSFLVLLMFVFHVTLPAAGQSPAVTFSGAAPVSVDTQTVGKLNNIRYLDGVKFPCSAAGITAAINDLPATGGIVDGRNCQGAQSLSANPFSGVTKPVTLLLGDATWSAAAGTTIAITSTFQGIVGSGKGRSTLQFANTGAVDGMQINPGSSGYVFLDGLAINGQNTGTGHGIHVQGGGPLYFRNLQVTAFGGNCVFMDAGTNGIQRLTAEGEIETDHCTGDGWKNLVSTNLRALGIAWVAHLETHNNTGFGYHTVGTRSTNGTCNNGLVFGLLRSENNTSDNVRVENDCDQTMQELQAEGSGGYGLNIDPNSKYVYVWDVDCSGNTQGGVNNAGTNTYISGPCVGTPQFDLLNIYQDASSSGAALIVRSGSGATGDLVQYQASNSVLQAKIANTGGYNGPNITLPYNGEAFSASPRRVWSCFFPGALTATWTGCSFNPDKAITITRIIAYAKTGPSGCTTNAVAQISDGTTPKTVAVTTNGNDSGGITQNYAAGVALNASVSTAAAGCTTSPADMNVSVEYRMQ